MSPGRCFGHRLLTELKRAGQGCAQQTSTSPLHFPHAFYPSTSDCFSKHRSNLLCLFSWRATNLPVYRLEDQSTEGFKAESHKQGSLSSPSCPQERGSPGPWGHWWPAPRRGRPAPRRDKGSLFRYKRLRPLPWVKPHRPGKNTKGAVGHWGGRGLGLGKYCQRLCSELGGSPRSY